MMEEFRYYLKVERGFSRNTVQGYCHDVQAFSDWLKKRGKRANEAGAEDINEYLIARTKAEQGLSKRSQARLLSAIKAYFKWLIIEGEVKENPCDGVDAPKIGRYLPDVLSVQEVEAILESVADKTWMDKRDRAILEVLYSCGLRVSEAATIGISQFFFNEGFVRVFGKGSKERLVPLGEIAAQAVKDYLDVRPEAAEPKFSDALFLNRNGAPLSRISIFKLVKKQAALAGVMKEISPHTFRHSFATHMIENGADLRVVQEMLGHESILTTEIYTHVDQSAWQRMILDSHPNG